MSPESQDPAEGGLHWHPTQTHTGSNRHPGSHQHAPASFQPLCWLCHFSVCLAFLLGCSCYVCSFQTPAICFLLSAFLCSQNTYQHQPTGLQCDQQIEVFFVEEVIHHISNAEMTAVRQNTPWTHTNRHTHTCSSVWRNRDRSQPDLTIAERKKSIKQQVHFSAEAFKNMAASHCRSFVGEDKKSAPAEIPQPWD